MIDTQKAIRLISVVHHFFFFLLTSRKKNADLGQLATGSVQSLWPINYNDMINNIL